MSIRIATFNLENLYARFDFAGKVAREARVVGTYAVTDKSEYETVRMAFEAVASDDMRQLTALALADTRADIVCLQEVDSQQALDVFYSNYLHPVLRQRFAQAVKGWSEEERHASDARYFYDHRYVLTGNDTRGIDVGVISRLPLAIQSHAALTYDFIADAPLDWALLESHNIKSDSRILRRDCIAMEFEIDGAPLTVFNCHFKSMSPNGPHRDGRADSQPLRAAEVWAVRRIVEQRFRGKPQDANWAICGDFNDFCEVDGAPAHHSALGPLLNDGFAIDPMGRRPAHDRWTHYYPEGDAHVQLDYVLLSPRLAAANPHVAPAIVRQGLPWRVPRLENEPRYPRIGWARPKASDHCPVVIEIDVPK